MGKGFTYILTNKNKTVLYTGVTNNLSRRLSEHYQDAITTKATFAGKYNCYNLVYFEEYETMSQAIAREKEIKLLNRCKKETLINSFNPNWEFLKL